MSSARARRFRIGVVATEFSEGPDPRLGLEGGGFGFAARNLGRLLHRHDDAGIEVVFLSAFGARGRGEVVVPFDGTHVRFPNRRMSHAVLARYAERIDLLVAVDWRPGYRYLIEPLVRTPLLIWSQAPVSQPVLSAIAGAQPPDALAETPTAAAPAAAVDPSLAELLRRSRRWGRPTAIAVTGPSLLPRFTDRYGIAPEAPIELGYGLQVPPPGATNRAERPTVAFLGRFDPIKRPWVLMALAEALPDVEFEVMADMATARWQPERMPPNVRLLGFTDGDAKQRALERAWVLVNTSVTEGVPVSFCEALAREVPLAALVDPEGLASRFGAFAGAWPGDGLAGVDALRAGVVGLLDDAERRHELGRAGRQWVVEHHGVDAFYRAFGTALERLGLAGPAALVEGFAPSTTDPDQ